MTRTLLSNILVTGGKEGGGLDNVCGLDCSLKSCDLEMLLQGGDVRPIEHGLPCRSLWKVQAIRARMVVCLFKRGRPYLDIWSLD